LTLVAWLTTSGWPAWGKVALALAAAYCMGWGYFVAVESKFLSLTPSQKGRGVQGPPTPPAQSRHSAIAS
jgi:hypothetical protein